MKKLKNMKGITLIALVITIVVLLILAGVTIAMLTGDNGILTKAQSAKKQNAETTLEEQIKLAVMASRMNENNNFEIDLSLLEEELKNNIDEEVAISKKGENEKLPWIIQWQKYMYEIKGNGSIEKISGVILSRTEIKVLKGADKQKIIATLTQDVSGTITWTSSNNDVATVDNGEITFIGIGTATITAMIDEEHKSTCVVKVMEALNSIVLTEDDEEINSISIEQGKSITLKAIPKGETGNITEYEELNMNINNDNISGTIDKNADGTYTIVLSSTRSSKVGENASQITIFGKETSNITKSYDVEITIAQHTSRELDYTWAELNEVAKSISNNSDINKDTLEFTITVNGKEYFLGIGDTKAVSYNGTEQIARIIGFKHDELTNKNIYGGNNEYAGITFEFIDSIDYISMNIPNTNSGGWAVMQLRGSINDWNNGMVSKLDMNEYIKQVRKDYISDISEGTVSKCDDYLWLLSCSEMYNSGSKDGYYGNSIAKEGEEYKYYADYNGFDSYRGKSSSSGLYWLRSPNYVGDGDFIVVNTSGGYGGRYSGWADGVAPGFAI